MRVLFLDDSHERHRACKHCLIGHDAHYAFSAAEAISMLKGERFDLACLDHDLDELAAAGMEPREKTGMHVAEHIVAMPRERRPRAVLVHSMNVPAASRMMATLLREVDGLMGQPFSADTVAKAVQAVKRMTR